MDTQSSENEVFQTLDIGISGMTCDHCVRRVEQALRSVNGVREVRVSRESARATVTFEPARTNVPALHDALLKSGYKPAVSAEPSREEGA